MSTITTGQSCPMASLYVGDLHPDVNESILFEKFSASGPVLSIRVCRDILTRRSLGYAYVNFQQPADAERALDTMNFECLYNQPIRIMWSQRDPALRKSGIGNVFIKNLHPEIDNKALYDTFSVFGNILSCKIMHDDHGRSKGFGFVHFECQEAADSAIAQVNGMVLKDKTVFVGQFKSKSERNRDGQERKFNNVFIKNFADALDTKKLSDMFAPFGEIVSAKVMCNDEGKSKGFGFVCYRDPANAERAVKAMNGTMVGDREIYVGRAQVKAERTAELRNRLNTLRSQSKYQQQGVNLYIKNLDDSFDDEKLRTEFSSFGEITSAKVMTDEHNRSKGFGFVCFSAPEEAARALTAMNGRIVGTKPLYVALAQRKEERRQHLQNQMWIRLNNLRLGQPLATATCNPFIHPTPPQGNLSQVNQLWNRMNNLRIGQPVVTSSNRTSTAAFGQPSLMQAGMATTMSHLPAAALFAATSGGPSANPPSIPSSVHASLLANQFQQHGAAQFPPNSGPIPSSAAVPLLANQFQHGTTSQFHTAMNNMSRHVRVP